MQPIVAFDFETYPIGNHSVFPKPVCVSACKGRNTSLYRHKDIELFLEHNIEHSIMIAHNATFECGVIYTHFPNLRNLLFKALDEGRIICTLIQEQLNDTIREKPIKKFSLDKLVKYYFDEDISATKKGEDSWRLRYNELEFVDEWPEEAIKYAIDDSIWAYKLYEKQLNNKLRPIEAQKDTVRASVYLNLMGAKGAKLDNNRVEILRQEILEYLQPRYTFLIDCGFAELKKGRTLPTKKTKKLRDYVISKGFELRYTIKGDVSTDGEALDFYKSQIDDKIIQTFSEISVYEKVLTAYIGHMEEDTLFSQYTATIATGRTSSSGSKLFNSMNIQQMPREVPGVTYDIRNCFVPREGKKIVSIDYMGLELCSTAHQLYSVYGKSCMRDTLNSGNKPVDMHSKLAARIKGISYEEFLVKKAEYKSTRQLAKPINLGFPGGIGYDTMRHQLWQSGINTVYNVIHKDKSKRSVMRLLFLLNEPNVRLTRLNKEEYALVEDELVGLKRDFFSLYPELEDFLKERHNRYLTGESKYIKNEFGEWENEPMYCYSTHGFKRDWCTYTAFCNGFLMQSPSAKGAKQAVVECMKQFHDNEDITPLFFIHDEIVFEVREQRTDLVDQAANIMIEAMQKTLPSVRITVEASMSDFWQKADGFWTQTYWKDAI